LLTAAAFIGLGFLFIPILGLQNDESLFASWIFEPVPREYRVRLFRRDLPLMLMTYLGCAKTWLYAAIFSVFPPNVWSVRVPAVLIGGGTIIAFGVLLRRIGGSAAALIGALLLALDPSFVLTTTFDWGPVALQHLFLVLGIIGVHRFAQTGSRRALAWGFACLGLGLWDKALFVWSLVGLSVAVAAVFPLRLWRALSFRNAALAAGAFLLGALPLVIYNVRFPLNTFRGNASLSTADFPIKAVNLRSTLDGSALFGYFVREEWEPQPRELTGPVERASARLRDWTGARRFGYLPWALGASLLLLPLARRHAPAVLFAFLSMAVSWTLMALTRDAGGSAHHVVLLWPFPHFAVALVAAAFWESRRRWIAAALGLALGVVLIQNLLVLNQYYVQAARNGTGFVWTDAIFELHQAVGGERQIHTMDWGMEFTLSMLAQGRFHRHWAAGIAEAEPLTDDKRKALRWYLEQKALYVDHVPAHRVMTGLSDRFEQWARQENHRKEMVRTISDRNGRPIFELYRYVPATP
jgi:hypothetical protein